MTLNVFSAGNFASWSPLAEWDGTNETDIRDWIRGLDPHDSGTEANRWAVSSVTGSQVVFTRPATHADGGPVNVAVALNMWVTAKVPGNMPALLVQAVSPAGKWVTTDPYGRPNDANDLLA